MKKYEKIRILENLKVVENNLMRGKIHTNVAAYAVKAIKEDFRPHKTPVEK